ncbi:hypothetical protein SLEP1_g56855 [Rubroshorea leprosula]|uniref:Uncharacterized protein n=1 Tax=Rubroshorea leprosula TaxID=152421 RepID=A0AAV5ML04_9ROSI|nr:hypothetical protein SLEP1_g56855 [Rubroshorea leprosula]
MKNVKPTARSEVLRLGSTIKNANANIGERSLPSRLPMYDRGQPKNATSYLFSNFPEDWSPKRLWFLFATYGAGLGRIVDVFIPRKKDRKGNKFGFVRFSEVRDKARLEKMLKMICFGTEQLRISLAKERKPLQPALKHHRPLPPPPPPGTLKTKSYAEALLNGLNSPDSDSQTRRTNAMPQTCPLGKFSPLILFLVFSKPFGRMVSLTSQLHQWGDAKGEGFLGVEGLWGINKATCYFVNVYGPCNVAGRAKLWEDLSTLIGTLNFFFCLGGDFNCVRGMHERKVEGYWGFKCKEKLRRLKQHLKKWNKEVFGNIDSQLEQAMKKVDFVDIKCEDQDLSEEDVLKRKDGFEELWLCLKKKESLWRQKSRVTWIKEGDANTAYFHKFVNSRRKKNMLHGVNNQGSWIDDPIQVKQIVYDHFKSQYSSQSTQQVQPSFDHLQFCRLLEEDRILLEVEFTDDEIREAVSSCASDKAPGPDGFNFHFIKLAWGTVGVDIINFIKEFHQNARLVKGINSSYITLVPKKKNPTSLKEFRPICTIGSMYKILAKVLANRLKKVIAKIISASQSAFIKGRQLVDCSFALNEIIHDLKIKRRKGIIFKANFEKAFDSVDWGYLDKMLSFLGFGEKWRSWIKECLRSASISILVNGSPTEEFNMQRGLRQGDPFSPYLFLIVAEGFHALLLEAKKKRRL